VTWRRLTEARDRLGQVTTAPVHEVVAPVTVVNQGDLWRIGQRIFAEKYDPNYQRI